MDGWWTIELRQDDLKDEVVFILEVCDRMVVKDVKIVVCYAIPISAPPPLPGLNSFF